MSEEVERVDPSGIPEFTGNLSMLAANCMGLDAAESGIRGIGSDVHDEFQGLSSFYTAPEAEQLFATTGPARDRAAEFADDLAAVRSALWDYHEEITPIVGRLNRLRYETEQFVESIRNDDDWKKSESKVDRNNGLLTDISTTIAQFWAAERSCANRINALWGGPQWTTDDGSGGEHMYGVSEEEMAQAGETPWGRAVEREYSWYRVDQHLKSFVWDGIIVDGIWGTITGLGGLLGFQGWDVFKESWKGLGQLATGLAIVTSPLNALAYSLMPDGAVKDWMDDSLDVTRETAKGLVAWDMWSEDPARAAGLTTFNVLTTVASFGAGAGVRAAASGAGTATRITAAAARVGTVIDPMTYITRGLTTMTRFGEISSQLANLTTTRAFELPDGSLRLDNGSVIPANGPFNRDVLPPGHHAVGRPDGSALWDDGTILHPDGRLESPTGQTIQAADEIPVEISARDRSILDSSTPEPALAGATRPDLNAQANATPPDSPPPSQRPDTVPTEGPTRDLPGQRTPDSTPSSPHTGGGGGGGGNYPGDLPDRPSGSGQDLPNQPSGDGLPEGSGNLVDDLPEFTPGNGSEPPVSGETPSASPSTGPDGETPRGVPLREQPTWHGESAGLMRHHRGPALDVQDLKLADQQAILRNAATDLADAARSADKGSTPPGQSRLETGCAGSLLHDGTVTSHTSTTKMHGQKLPTTHPVLADLLDRIAADADAGRIPPTGIGHGKCAEVSLISDRLAHLESTGQSIRTLDEARAALEGSVIHSVQIGDVPKLGLEHGAYKAPCQTCTHIVSELGITALN
ncbi:YwqJ-related putative deaminase [Streptomyces xiamenensis]|uniref:YwqJ-related putative deaminase n=1 Tax=Streptomyces xiamenensis TaxID=408015 RepID=UPI00369E5F1F